MGVLADQETDFPRWYQDVINKAELADVAPVKGTWVIRPYTYSMWELIQAKLDQRIKACGVENAYFPLFIPESYFKREAEHVEGFSPELAVVTHAGGKELEEKVVVRPTSETIIGESMAKWIQSYRDLPLLLNQWANVVRWELRPRAFLRTTEFLWQEGHTAHATKQDAANFARLILLDVYEKTMVEDLAIPVIIGRKTARERFAGSANSMTCEGMMGDGKALQMGTSHELAQNFAKAFDIKFSRPGEDQELAWTTSWGVSTRLIGGVIMGHGDNQGLKVPPNVAPIQCVVVPVGEDTKIMDAARNLFEALKKSGTRVKMDEGVDKSLGRRLTNWELKGVPVRAVIGKREIESGSISVTRRDTSETQQISLNECASHIENLLGKIQDSLRDAAKERLSSMCSDVDSIPDALVAAKSGFARLPWKVLGEEGETELAKDAVTVRCLELPGGGVPSDEEIEDSVAVVARAY